MVGPKPRARPQLLSMLLQRYTTQREQFVRDAKTPWLVWEHGPWKPPSSDDQTASAPNLKLAEALAEGTDLLCFQLTPVAGQSSVFRVGRDRGCEVNINDATVSRKHLELVSDAAGRWTVDGGASGPTQLKGQVVGPGAHKPIASKDELRLGGVRLTFYSPEDWLARLEVERRAPRGKPVAGP